MTMIFVYNEAGILIEEFRVDDKEFLLHTENYLPGTYVLRVKTEKGIINKTFTVK